MVRSACWYTVDRHGLRPRDDKIGKGMVVCTTLSLRGGNTSERRGNPSCLERMRTICLFASWFKVDRHGLSPRDDKIGGTLFLKTKDFIHNHAEGLTRGVPFPQIRNVEIMEAVIYGMAGMSVGLIASVPASRRIRYCSGDKIFRHCSLVFSTDSDFIFLVTMLTGSELCNGKKPDNKAKVITLIVVNKVINFMTKI